VKVVGSIHVDIIVEPSDYFVVAPDAGETIKITLTNGNRRPLNLRQVPRRAVYGLVTQLTRCMLGQDMAKADGIIPEPAPSAEQAAQDVFDELQKILDEE
jgi:hypothetical protein